MRPPLDHRTLTLMHAQHRHSATEPRRRTTRRRRLAAMVATAIAAGATLALSTGLAHAAAPGDLDPTFDSDGKVILPFTGAPRAVLVQPDGKIVLAGSTPEYDFSVLRLNPDGSVDRRFGREGQAVADFGGDDYASSAALQPDGKIVVAGPTGMGPGVARFTSSGSLDATFDPGGPDGDGKKVLVTSDALSADAVVVQRDGRIAIAGSYWSSTKPADFTITRLKPGGGVDGTTFDLADAGGEDWARAAAMGTDGRIVVVGTSQPSGATEPVTGIARYSDDGTLDKTFAETGKTTVAGLADPKGVLIQPDGKVLIVARSKDGDPLVARLTRDGKLDGTFGDGGIAAGAFDGEKLATDALAALRPDGKLFVAGTAADATAFAVGRLTPLGALDSEFGSGGRTAVDFDGVSVATAGALQPDGKLVVAGATLRGVSAKTTVVRVFGDATAPPAGGAQDPGPAKPSVLRCAGRRATIVGTRRGETLRGTRRADVIVALGGDDRVVARGGNDLVCGGAGNDRLSGGRGRDRLLGGRGRDRLAGGPGRDRLVGGLGRDRARP